MKQPLDLDARKHQLNEWYQSEKYQQLCQHFTAECNRLSLTAQRLFSRIDAVKATCQAQTVRQELAVQCRYAHRGFYCPNPVYELIIGNSRRGKILKRPSATSKPVYEYGFDACDQLLWAHNREQNNTEYLIYEGNTVCGITVDKNGTPSTFTEETYENGRITVFYIAHFYPFSSDFSCMMLKADYFEYDALGLCAVKMYEHMVPPQSDPDFAAKLNLPAPFLKSNCRCIVNWRFEREDGLLTGYRAYPIDIDRPPSGVFPIQKPRKA